MEHRLVVAVAGVIVRRAVAPCSGQRTTWTSVGSSPPVHGLTGHAPKLTLLAPVSVNTRYSSPVPSRLITRSLVSPAAAS